VIWIALNKKRIGLHGTKRGDHWPLVRMLCSTRELDAVRLAQK